MRRGDISGILNIDKPRGKTSHGVVKCVRRISGQRRVGHAGTLDPQATGVLLLALGEATRVIEYLMEGRKAYRAHICLGIETDTYDGEGGVVYRSPEVAVSRSQIERTLDLFLGKIQQVPPMYSAVKHQGRPLYSFARQGITLERKPRLVEIHRMEIVDWAPPYLTVEIECSKGTYIRSLAHDLGEKLGCRAYLEGLIRLVSGRFTLEDAISLPEVVESFAKGCWQRVIHPLDEALLDYDAMAVDEERERKLRHGQQIEGKASTTLCRIYSLGGDLIAIAQYDPSTQLWQPRKVFSKALSPGVVEREGANADI